MQQWDHKQMAMQIYKHENLKKKKKNTASILQPVLSDRLTEWVGFNVPRDIIRLNCTGAVLSTIFCSQGAVISAREWTDRDDFHSSCDVATVVLTLLDVSHCTAFYKHFVVRVVNESATVVGVWTAFVR